MSSRRLSSFKPVVDRRSRVLILGTMPGPEALRRREYYGYPLNHFWKILPQIFDKGPLDGYREKIRFLRKKRIALWDVIGSCKREGAADQKIQEVKTNDISDLLRRYPNIRKVFLNGRLAQKLYQKYFGKSLRVPACYLPSTSPANAGLGFEKKTERWRVVAVSLRSGIYSRNRRSSVQQPLLR